MAQNQNTPLIKEIAQKQLEQAAQISDLFNKLDNAEMGIQRILFILENDKGTGQHGLVAQVREIAEKVENHEHFKKNLEGRMWGLAIVGGFLASFIASVLDRVVNK